jgi:chromosome segregation and condensation protein ScpB
VTTRNPNPPHEKIRLLEAALFASGKPLDLKTMGSFLRLRSRKKIREIARDLAQRYIKYNGPLEIVELEDYKFVMQLSRNLSHASSD